MKLVVEESESSALRRALPGDAELVSSAIALVEIPRSASRHGQAAADRVRGLLAVLSTIALEKDLLRAAARIEPAGLRSLDAIHVASAALLAGRLGTLITYDRRMHDAALRLGLPVTSPGALIE